MKTPLVIYPAMIAMLLTACGERNDAATEESIDAQNKISGEMHEGDTALVKRDGTLLEGAMDKVDSISLPSTIVNEIEADATLSKGDIVSTRKFAENNQTFYEVKFSVENNGSKTVVFDENGKRRGN
jgi:Iap family predicted aminopeptidase